MKASIFRSIVAAGLLLSALSSPVLADPHNAGVNAAPAALKADKEKVIFFAADGMRQDLAETYAGQGMMPAIAKLLRSGAKAADGGLLTQAPPNTGAGWYSLATGAWSGVHGSTNNTFHINGQAFISRTAAFDRERAAGRDAGPGRRARRQEGRPDRVGGRPQRRH